MPEKSKENDLTIRYQSAKNTQQGQGQEHEILEEAVTQLEKTLEILLNPEKIPERLPEFMKKEKRKSSIHTIGKMKNIAIVQN